MTDCFSLFCPCLSPTLQVSLLRDPVTRRLSGHAVVEMESPERVGLVEANLARMVRIGSLLHA